MRLLFLTQVLDRGDAVLGFVPRWVEGLAARCERVRVVALELGDLDGLPDNVDAREVGRRGTLLRWLRWRRHLREAFTRDGFDTVLAHMVPRYAVLAAGPARAGGARQFLWYTHGAVDQRLARAERLVESIFTASAESLRLATAKKVITGHGIDLEHFDDRGGPADLPPRLLSVGRLTAAKDVLTLVEALDRLVRRGLDLRLDLVGGELAEGDAAYAARVRLRIAELALGERVELHGSVPYRDVPALFRRCTLFVSASRTGSLDKVVLEAMAMRRPAVTCGEAYAPLLAELGSKAAALRFPPGDAAALAARVEALLGRSPDERSELGRHLRALVERDHEVDGLMGRLCARMEAGH